MKFDGEWKETEIGKIPEDWDIDTLNNVCLKITDGSHTSPKSFLNGCLMASVKDMSDYGFVFEECKRISKEDYELLVKNDCKPLLNDVLIAKDGSFLKHIFVVKKEIDMVILSSIAILRPNLNEVSPEFLKYYLSSNETKQRIKEGYVTGSVLPRIVLKDFKTIKIILPSLSEQKAIARILSSFDDKIELNSRMNKTLEEIGQSLFKHWFIDFEFPDEEGNPYKSSGGKMVESELGLIPEGWRIEKLGDLCNFNTGKLDSNKAEENGKYPFFTCSPSTLKINCYAFDCEEILLAGNNASGIYNVKYYNGKFNAYQRTYVITIKDITKINYQFLYYFMDLNLNYLKDISVGSATKFLTLKMLNSINIIIPKPNKVIAFYNVLKPMLNLIMNNVIENQNLSQIIDILLPKLMSGEISVKDIC